MSGYAPATTLFAKIAGFGRSLLLMLVSLSWVTGCESKWQKMSDHELAEKAAECLYMNSPGPAQIQVCKNYQRECERRREKGVFVC